MTVGLLGLLGRCQVVVVNGLVSGTDVLGLGVTIGLGREELRLLLAKLV